MTARVAHPETCDGCRKAQSQRLMDGETVLKKDGICLSGNTWGRGCKDYAEVPLPAHKHMPRL